MIERYVLTSLAALAAMPAAATDKVEQAPPPAWVKPVALPTLPKDNEQPVRFLLMDQQVRLEHGREARYSETAFRIQTPQGLAIGNISLPWRADDDRLIVHKLLIRRGDQVIDVLKNGQTFTVVRREPNLEMAMLDNVLTANIQPEGLQVGDILDMAATIISEDPTLKDHAEAVVATWNAPIVKAHARVEWPNDVAVRVRAGNGLPAVKPLRKGDVTSIEWAMDNVVPPVRPKLAPARFQVGRLAELSDYSDWGAVVGVMTPLYDKAATLKPDSPLQTEIARIKASSPDQVARAEAALALVEDRVRYVALVAGTGGLVPADADVTWSRRFGDCKGKTALLLAILRPLGISAEPVLVNTTAGDVLADRLPAAGLFDHVLVRALIGGKTYWLDGTRTGDTHLARLQVPFFRWGLPLAAGTTALVPIVPPPLDRPSEAMTVRIDARDGVTLPAPMHAEIIYRDDSALGVKLGLAGLVSDQRDRTLRDFWKGQFDFFDPKTVTASFNGDTGEEKLIADGTAAMDWKRGYFEIEGVSLGYTADLKRDPGPNSDAPYAVPFPSYSIISQTILLPPGWGNTIGKNSSDVDTTVAGIAYRRTSGIKDNVYTIEKSERSLAPEYSFAEAAMTEPKLRDLVNNTVALRASRDYRTTEKELAAVIATKPTTPDEMMKRGAALYQMNRKPEALAEVDRVLAIDPKNAGALRFKAMMAVASSDAVRAAKDIELAAAANPDDPMLAGLLGSSQMARQDNAGAVATLTAAIAKSPNNGALLAARAQAYSRLGDEKQALADCNAAIAAHTGNPETYLLKANLLSHAGRRGEMEGVASAVASDLPRNTYAHVIAAGIYWSVGKKPEALHEYDVALAIRPEAYIYINRAERRPKEEAAAALVDYDAALKLDPKHDEAYAGKARILSARGDQAGALKTIEAGLAINPASWSLRASRLWVHARQQQLKLVDQDVATFVAQAPNAMVLNNLCYGLAQQKLVLMQALTLCEAAIAKQPDSSTILDSRGYVKLLLGRNEEAIADFDRVLAKAPNMAPSLYGRAIAYARKGDAARSRSDADAAVKADPKIKETFAVYGITLEEAEGTSTIAAKTGLSHGSRP